MSATIAGLSGLESQEPSQEPSQVPPESLPGPGKHPVGRPRKYPNNTEAQRACRARKNAANPDRVREDQRTYRARLKEEKAQQAREAQWLAILKYHNDQRGRLPGEFNGFDDLEAIWAAHERDVHGGKVSPEGWGLSKFEQFEHIKRGKAVLRETDYTYVDRAFFRCRPKKKTCPISFHKFLMSRGDLVCQHCRLDFQTNILTSVKIDRREQPKP